MYVDDELKRGNLYSVHCTVTIDFCLAVSLSVTICIVFYSCGNRKVAKATWPLVVAALKGKECRLCGRWLAQGL